MAKIRNPKIFSEHFGVPTEDIARLGVLDPTLNVDTKLFIDPLLLEESRHIEISQGARSTYEQHFTRVIKLLRGTKVRGDVAWRNARRQLSFPEVKWTCLGYGAQSVSGSGSGSGMTSQYIDTAREIVDLGVEDPDLFVAMALFEEGVGPDRVSDMTTNVILGDLLRFNERVLKELDVPTYFIRLSLPNGGHFETSLPRNPFIRERGPVVLVPTDILRHLPIVTDWSEVADAASKNQQLRNRVNRDIARLWTRTSRKDKGELRLWAMSGKDEFETFLEMIRAAGARGYNTATDPQGVLILQRIGATFAADEPLTIEKPATLDVDGVAKVVEQIVEQYRFLIEERHLHKELYHRGKPRPERSAQMLFFAIAHSYCQANNLDLTPEANGTGNGQVDFKVSQGFKGRVLVEIKLSSNNKLVKGYTRQLEAYKRAEQTARAYYVVIDIGRMGKKDELLTQARNRAVSEGNSTPPIVWVDGKQKPSASKL